jgi:hypothetical protein
MSDEYQNVVEINVRYVLLNDEGESQQDAQWLWMEQHPGRRTWGLSFSAEDAHDFKDTHGEKAIQYASALSKIVKVSKHLIAKGYKPEVVYVRSVYKRTEVVVTDNAMAVIALAASDELK